jgi:hypothetical protein
LLDYSVKPIEGLLPLIWHGLAADVISIKVRNDRNG